MVGLGLMDALRFSLPVPVTYSATGPHGTSYEYYRDFDPPLEFDFGVSRQDRSASALWLSGYSGNYVGNCLGYLNEALERVEIKPDNNSITTKLVVKWERVAATLGSFAVFQMLLSCAALLYCRRGIEIVFASEEERQQAGALYQGRFVPEVGVPVRWALDTGSRAGRGTKVA